MRGRRVLIVVAALVLLGGCGHTGRATSGSPSSPPPHQAAPAWLVAICRQAATGYRDPSPLSIAYVRTTITALDLSWGAPPTHYEKTHYGAVYVVVLHGSFTDLGYRGDIANPSPPPPSQYVTLVIDARTKQGIGEQWGNTPPDTSSLGHLRPVTL